MCFVPEELNVQISVPSDKNEIDFQTVMEDTSKIMSIVFESKNSFDVPVVLKLNQVSIGNGSWFLRRTMSLINFEYFQNEPHLFSINPCLDDTLTSTKKTYESILLLKPKQKYNVNVEFEGVGLYSLGGLSNSLFLILLYFS